MSTNADQNPTRAPETGLSRWFRDEVHPHDGQLKSYIRGQFPSIGDVDDVVQESYLRIWRARASKPIESAKAFLFRIARHIAIDDLRRKRRAPLVTLSDFDAANVLDRGPTTSETVVTNEMLQLLADAVIALPATYRQVVVLHKIDGLSQRDVAEKLGLSLRSVEKYCERGMLKCETYLRDRGVEGFYKR